MSRLRSGLARLLARPSGIFQESRFFYWLMAAGKFGVGQAGVQGLNAVSGLLVVRQLTKTEYGFFVIASTVQNMVTQLAETGLGIGIVSEAGRLGEDRSRLGQLVNAALDLRRRTTFLWMGLSLVPLYWMLHRAQVPMPYGLLLMATVVVSIGSQMNTGIFRASLQARGRFGPLQKMEFVMALVRLGLLGAAALWFLDAELAMLCTVASLLAQWFVARGDARGVFQADAPASAADRANLSKRVRQLLPDAIFYCLQGQVWLLLVMLVGKTGQVAEIGALGRLSILFVILGSVMGNILAPAFSRSSSPRVLVKRYLQIVAAYLALGLGLLAAVSAFPRPLLWLLGDGYRNLQAELVLLTVNAVLGSIAQAMWSLNAVRGWTEGLWIEIPIRLLLQVVLLCFLDVSTTPGVLWFMILANISPIGVSLFLACRGLGRMRRNAPAAA